MVTYSESAELFLREKISPDKSEHLNAAHIGLTRSYNAGLTLD